MNSSHYSPPTPPAREILADMILWYTSPQRRRELIGETWEIEQTPLDDLIDQATALLSNWTPTTDYQWTVVRSGRTTDWLVWQTALGSDPTWAEACDDIEMIEPWAVVLATLRCTGGCRPRWRPPTRPRRGGGGRRPAGRRARRSGVLTAGQRCQLAGWSSLAQWIGSDKGAAAVAKIEQVWPGYTTVAYASILNAYYTDPGIIATVWAWLAGQGITFGHGWEPGCGRGDWIAHAPGEVTFDAVDIDPISVKVARLLTGAHVEQARLEEWNLSRSTRVGIHGYDLVVGNVPFSAVRPAANNPHGDNLHNLAVAQAVDMLRPGGVAAMLTSRFALDAVASRAWRQRLAGQVDLVAAIRLPAGAHHSAGTDVVTDLLILRRPLPGEQRPPVDWVDTVELAVDGDSFHHNQHFAEHPERVLGSYRPGGAYRRENLNVVADRPTAELLAGALQPLRVGYRPTAAAPQPVIPIVHTSTGRRLPPGSIVVERTVDGGFSRDGQPHRVATANRLQIAALCTLRDHVLDYLDHPNDDGRAELAQLYLTYRQRYPPLNRYTLKPVADDTAEEPDGDRDGGEVSRFKRVYPRYDGFRSDPSWWSVAAIESFDDDTQEGHPAAILQHPVIATGGDRWPTAAATITEAMANSVARYHRRSPARSPRRCRRRLTQAEITPELGVTWLTAEDISAFVADQAGGDARVMYHPPSGRWSADGWAPPGPA